MACAFLSIKLLEDLSHTHDFGGENCAAVVVEFVLVENDLVEEEDLLPQLQSLVIDS